MSFFAALPPVLDFFWLPVPNLGGEGVRRFFGDWGLEGLILSGGNDVGQCPRRDATEGALLDTAMERGLPVLGVCRGLQFINTHLGGTVASCPDKGHVNTRHAVRDPDSGAFLREVNSFHGLCIGPQDLAPDLRPLACAPGGWVEAARHVRLPVAGVMWHPEREATPCAEDVALLQELFAGGA
ncbi:gamma-glutamyl-gamma-aminobutyrate hydrolase family protein [Desulfocurvus sp. DL9XJH121]